MPSPIAILPCLPLWPRLRFDLLRTDPALTHSVVARLPLLLIDLAFPASPFRGATEPGYQLIIFYKSVSWDWDEPTGNVASS